MSLPLRQPLLLYTHTHSPSLHFPQSQTLTLIHHRRHFNPNSPTNQFPLSLRRVKKWSVVRSSVKGSNNDRRKRAINEDGNEDESGFRNGAVKIGLWVMEGVYISWLFLLPFAPGDPVWAISSETITSLIGLSLNFFFILPLSNAVGIHVMDAPVLHPMSEGLFNFVLAWTLMFAPLLYTDCKRNRYKGSLDVLWGLQMFLTNTFLIPYMAIRLNQGNNESNPTKLSQLGTLMIKGAPTIGLVGGGVCLISILWALFGREDTGFGTINERLDFLLSYLGSERLAYAFVWDILLYTIFQPWLIGENLDNVEENRVDIVGYLRFIPVVGLFAYLICLKNKVELYMVNSRSND